MVNGTRAIDQVLPELSRQLWQSMGRVLYRYRIPVQDAEDLVQTALLLAVSKWQEIRDPEAWLWGTLQKRCIIYWRKHRLQVRRFAPLADTAMSPAMVAAQARWEMRADLGTVSRALPATQRRLIALRFELGLTAAEAARATGLASGSVRKVLQRALARLREQLDVSPWLPARARPESRGARSAERDAAPAAWSAAVDSWLGAADLRPQTRYQYRLHLAAAGAALGHASLAALTPADLAGYRSALLGDGRSAGTHLCVLQALRSFLVWASQQGLHGVDAESVRTALRGWHGVGKRARLARCAVSGRAAVAAGKSIATATSGRNWHPGEDGV